MTLLFRNNCVYKKICIICKFRIFIQRFMQYQNKFISRLQFSSRPIKYFLIPQYLLDELIYLLTVTKKTPELNHLKITKRIHVN